MSEKDLVANSNEKRIQFQTISRRNAYLIVLRIYFECSTFFKLPSAPWDTQVILLYLGCYHSFIIDIFELKLSIWNWAQTNTYQMTNCYSGQISVCDFWCIKTTYDHSLFERSKNIRIGWRRFWYRFWIVNNGIDKRPENWDIERMDEIKREREIEKKCATLLKTWPHVI